MTNFTLKINVFLDLDGMFSIVNFCFDLLSVSLVEAVYACFFECLCSRDWDA